MDYKVILYSNDNAGISDDLGNFQFYTNDEAELCCTRWVSIGSSYKAHLWNGDIWTYFD